MGIEASGGYLRTSLLSTPMAKSRSYRNEQVLAVAYFLKNFHEYCSRGVKTPIASDLNFQKVATATNAVGKRADKLQKFKNMRTRLSFQKISTFICLSVHDLTFCRSELRLL